MRPEIMHSFVKEAVELSDKKKWYAPLGAVLGTTLGVGGLLLARPALRAESKALLKALLKGKGSHAAEQAQGIHPAAIPDIKAVAAHLRQQGINPRTAKIGISGTGGTGKSTMADGLAEELGMKITRKAVPELERGGALIKSINAQGAPAGHISDQTFLFNKVDPDHFDVIIRAAKPIEQVTKQIVRRGRGAIQVEHMNYPLLHGTIEKGFSATAGKATEAAPGFYVKVKPPGGFKADAHLDRELTQLGISPEGLGRHDKILSTVKKRRAVVKGTKLPYLRKKRITLQASTPILGGAGGGLAGGALGRRIDETT